MWDKEVKELTGYFPQEAKIPISADTKVEIKQKKTTGKFC